MTTNHKPTGYPKGRPRLGEVRPTTPGGIESKQWREANPELYLERNREYTRRWRANNYERVIEIEKNTVLRKQARKKLELLQLNTALTLIDTAKTILGHK